jgi:hypothetical protein
VLLSGRHTPPFGGTSNSLSSARALPYSSADAARVSLIITSCAPFAWMLSAEAIVSRAVRCSSAIVSAPQLHIVERTFASVVSRRGCCLRNG